ncbi:MAG: S-methyl-5'-thioinosine phosphorylase [Agarilytica sp.]
MAVIAVIGGSGFYNFPELENQKVVSVETPYGVVDDIVKGVWKQTPVLYLPRHGGQHRIPPHKVNYRANISALATLGAEKVVAFNATGGIGESFSPGTFVVPDQIIDYSYGRSHTFFEGDDELLSHIDFTFPFEEVMRQDLLESLRYNGVPFYDGGTYGCTQGPRLESAAEVKKLRNDGCDLVGMTLMPEAALAREKELAYVSLSFIVNWCAGVRDEVISLDKIMARLESSVPKIREVILKMISLG